jgi:DNA-directed RNA polymerase subunit omega
MSIYPSPDKLDKMESKYALVIIAAKRARQIKDGARRLIDSRAANPITAALEEIAEGAIIARVVEDPTVAAAKAALRPNVPSLEDIIGAGPVLAIEPEQDSTAAQLAALRSAEPDSDDEDLGDDDPDETLRPVDAFVRDSPGLMTHIDDDDDLIPELDEDED